MQGFIDFRFIFFLLYLYYDYRILVIIFNLSVFMENRKPTNEELISKIKEQDLDIARLKEEEEFLSKFKFLLKNLVIWYVL